MDIWIEDIPRDATRLDVVRLLRDVLHKEPFYNDKTAPPFNFRVELDPGQPNLGFLTGGTGKLTLPTRSLGEKFMDFIEELSANKNNKNNGGKKKSGLSIDDLQFVNPQPCVDEYAKHLRKLRWISPEEEEERARVVRTLDDEISVNKLDMGFLEVDGEDSLTFRPEWHPEQKQFYLVFEFDHKLVRLKLGDPSSDDNQHLITIHFDNIRRILHGDEFMEQYIIFQLYHPPAYEWNEMILGVERVKNRARGRVTELSERHGIFAPYLRDIRFTLTNFHDVKKFMLWCKMCSLTKPVPKRVPSDRIGAYAYKELDRLKKWFGRLDFRVAFQCEALVRNGLLNPQQLHNSIKPMVEGLLVERGVEATAQILRHFNDKTRERISSNANVTLRFQSCIDEWATSRAPSPGDRLMWVHRVTVTPSGMRLAGPHLLQSNRVLRQYRAHHHFFLRVDFRDEQLLQLRWTVDVDGEKFVQGRVGADLKTGFDLAGRHFEFLAYSLSGLKEHSVWFVAPFDHPGEGRVDAESIRSRLGDFSKAIHCPALFGARLAQAFSSTDPTIVLAPHQWQDIPDIQRGKWVHTDGVGTMSSELNEMIWEKFKNSNAALPRPSVYQVRIGGYKGVIVEDPFLEGVMLCLRPSMKKFDVFDLGGGSEKPWLEIEIASAFIHPMKMYLNRPLIQILERLAVTTDNLMKFQKAALDEIEGSKNSMSSFLAVLQSHKLGMPFKLGQILKHLIRLTKGSLPPTEQARTTIFGPFIRSLVDYGVVHTHRQLKYKARIPIPDSWNLVGVADEGWRLRKKFPDKKFRILKDRQIFAAIRDSETQEIKYLKGQAWITRSPTVHPGDIQTVYAVGKPELEDGELCFFDKLVNCVVFSCAGNKRPLTNYLGGGDLDGDTYMICQQPSLLLPLTGIPPANYEPVPKTTLDRPSTVEDVADFVVEYINFDKLGLLGHKQMVIADQSYEGIFDERCLVLAELCSQAVDFGKVFQRLASFDILFKSFNLQTGTRPKMENEPKRYMAEKPDWSQNETAHLGEREYYKSDKALGELFRAIDVGKLPTPSGILPPGLPVSQGYQLITKTLKPFVTKYCGKKITRHTDIQEIYEQYITELSHIAYSHALSTNTLAKLQEEEIVLGAIMAPSSQDRYHKEKTASLRTNADHLVRFVHSEIGDVDRDTSHAELCVLLARAWSMWAFSLKDEHEFGKPSFGLIALDIFFRVLGMLDESVFSQDSEMQGDSFYTGTLAPRDAEEGGDDQVPEQSHDRDDDEDAENALL